MIYRKLKLQTEVEAFREWARQNYKKGSPINPLWHPVVKDECEKINAE